MVQAVIWTVLFVIPGYVASSTKHFWLSTGARPFDRTSESIAWSLAIYTLAALTPTGLFDLSQFAADIAPNINNPERFLFSRAFLQGYGYITLLGLAAAGLYVSAFSSREWANILGRTPYARVWDEFWTANKNKGASAGVWLEMKDGTQVAGELKRASDTPGERELWLTGVKQFKEGHLFQTPTTDLLVSSSEVSRIYVLEPHLTSGIASPAPGDAASDSALVTKAKKRSQRSRHQRHT